MVNLYYLYSFTHYVLNPNNLVYAMKGIEIINLAFQAKANANEVK